VFSIVHFLSAQYIFSIHPIYPWFQTKTDSLTCRFTLPTLTKPESYLFLFTFHPLYFIPFSLFFLLQSLRNIKISFNSLPFLCFAFFISHYGGTPDGACGRAKLSIWQALSDKGACKMNDWKLLWGTFSSQATGNRHAILLGTRERESKKSNTHSSVVTCVCVYVFVCNGMPK
jgi:hypothetical protein